MLVLFRTYKQITGFSTVAEYVFFVYNQGFSLMLKKRTIEEYADNYQSSLYLNLLTGGRPVSEIQLATLQQIHWLPNCSG